MVKNPDTRIGQNSAMHERPPASATVFQAERGSPGSRIARMKNALSETARNVRSAVKMPLLVGVGLAAVTKLQLRTDAEPGEKNWKEYTAMSDGERAVYDDQQARKYTARAREQLADGDTDGARTSINTARVFRWR